MRLKTLAMIINPQMYAAIFGDKEEEDEIVQVTPQNEQEVAMVMEDLKALGILT